MIKNDKLDALIMMSSEVLAQKNEEDFKNTDTSNVKRPKSLDRRIKRLIEKEERKQNFAVFYTYARRTVAVILISCSILFAIAMGVKATRTAIVKAVVDLFDDYLSLSFDPNKTQSTNITQVGRPEWEREVVVDFEDVYFETYFYNGYKMITYQKLILEKADNWVDNKNTLVEYVNIGEKEVTLLTYKDLGTYSVVWNDDIYYYYLSSHHTDVTKEELIKWAELLV